MGRPGADISGSLAWLKAGRAEGQTDSSSFYYHILKPVTEKRTFILKSFFSVL